MVARLGGLDPSPVGMSAKQDGSTLTVTLRNRSEKPQTLDLAYELFDPNSIRVAKGIMGERNVQLERIDVIECKLDLVAQTRFIGRWETTPMEPGDHVVKLTAVTTEGARAIKLVNLSVP